ncbi:MAG: hypothetical protein AAF501_12660 [Pseudomonadota bacterium]
MILILPRHASAFAIMAMVESETGNSSLSQRLGINAGDLLLHTGHWPADDGGRVRPAPKWQSKVADDGVTRNREGDPLHSHHTIALVVRAAQRWQRTQR